MDFTRFVEMLFLGLLSGAVAWAARFLGEISRSISELNKQVGVILEKVTWHEKEIGEHGERLVKLEAVSHEKHEAPPGAVDVKPVVVVAVKKKVVKKTVVSAKPFNENLSPL